MAGDRSTAASPALAAATYSKAPCSMLRVTMKATDGPGSATIASVASAKAVSVA